MAIEAEFEREAAQMLNNMGLKDSNTLNFFQSSNFASGNQKWKEGLRKPASSSRIRRFSSAPREPRNEVDGSAMRKHLPVNRTPASTSNVHKQPTFVVSSTSDTAPNKPVATKAYNNDRSHYYVTRTKSAPENGHRGPGNDVGTRPNRDRPNVVSPHNQHTTHTTVPSKSSSSIKTVVKVPTVQQTPAVQQATIVKVKSTHIPVPVARTIPVQTVSKQRAPSPKHTSTITITEGEVEKKSCTGTKVLYSRKPALKLLSVTTSTSTKVQSVADGLKSDRPPLKTHQTPTTHYHPPVTTQEPNKSSTNTDHPSATSPPGTSQVKQSLHPHATKHVYQAYDRLEGYREVVLCSPELENGNGKGSKSKIHGSMPSVSPTRCSSVNSNASQGSNVSVKSSASSGTYDKQPLAQSSAIPRLRKQSAPSRVSSSSSRSRTPTPTLHSQSIKSTQNSSVQPTTDGSSQESSNSDAAIAGEKHKNGSLSKLSLEHQTSTASPEPEIVTMSILATNTVQALGTLMEVVTPTTSTENFDLLHSRDSQTKLDSTGSNSPSSDVVMSHHVQEIKTEPKPPSPTLSQKKAQPSSSHEPMNHHKEEPERTSVITLQSKHSSSTCQKTGIPSSRTARQRKVPLAPPPIPTKSSHGPTLLSPVDTSSKILSPKRKELAPATISSAKVSDVEATQNDSGEEVGGDVCVEDDEDFFGYCHQCGKAVVGEESGCLALGKVFHITCFSCSTCGKSLSGKTFYTVCQDILCEVDYLKRLQRCCFCNQRIKDKVLTAFGEVYHPACFRCVECGMCLDGVPYVGESHDKVYCIKDYHQLFAPPCASCGKPIVPTPGKSRNLRVQVKDMYYHVRCYKCEGCRVLFASTRQQSFVVDGHLYCYKCHVKHTEAHVRTTIL